MNFYIKKIITLIITLFFVSIATFVLFEVIPGDPVTSILGTEAPEERKEALREELGLDDPVIVRYARWIKGVLQGDLGKSYVYSENMNEMMKVSKLIGDKLPVTFSLALLSFIVIVIIAIPLGVLWAGSKSKILDGIMNVLSQVNMAIPSFFLGIIIIYVFGLVLKMFTPGKYVSYTEDFRGFIQYMIFPAFAVALPKISMVARFLRNSMLEQMQSDYVRTAYSKGSSKARVLYGHVLRNAFMPVITFLGMIIAETLAGSIVVEQVFSIPGIGRLLISSILSRDFPTIEVLVLYIAFAVIVVYFLVDMLYKLIDPRVSAQ